MVVTAGATVEGAIEIGTGDPVIGPGPDLGLVAGARALDLVVAGHPLWSGAGAALRPSPARDQSPGLVKLHGYHGVIHTNRNE